MEVRYTEAKTIEELYGTLNSLVPAGINGIIDRIIEANPRFIDPTIEMVEGAPQPVYQARFGNMMVIAIAEFLAFAFDRPEFSNLPPKGTD